MTWRQGRHSPPTDPEKPRNTEELERANNEGERGRSPKRQQRRQARIRFGREPRDRLATDDAPSGSPAEGEGRAVPDRWNRTGGDSEAERAARIPSSGFPRRVSEVREFNGARGK